MTRMADRPQRELSGGRADGDVFDLQGKAVCPFCGNLNESRDAGCARCGMENTTTTRQATRARIGPWSVLQTRNPSAPGMKFGTLLALVKKGQVTPRSIVRGPTTHQLWKPAGKVKGLSREFGICFGCAQDVEPTDSVCMHCQRNQEPPADPDVLLEPRASVASTIALKRQVRPAFASEDEQRPRPRPMPRNSVTEAANAAAAAAEPIAAGRAPSAQPAKAQPQQFEQTLPPRRGTNASAILDPRELAAAYGQPPTRERPMRPLVKGAMVIALLALFGGGAWVYVDEGARAKFLEKVKEFRPAAQATEGETVSPETQRRLEELMPAEVQTSPRLIRPSDVPVAATPAPKETPKAAPTPEPAAPAVVETPQPQPAAAAPADELAGLDDRQKSRRLYSLAMDAEARGDWKQALSYYEQIAKLPIIVQNSDIEARIKIAKRQIGE